MSADDRSPFAPDAAQEPAEEQSRPAPHAVKTFIYNVTAGRSEGVEGVVGDGSSPAAAPGEATAGAVRRRRVRIGEAPRRAASDREVEPAAIPLKPMPRVGAGQAPVGASPPTRPRKRRRRPNSTQRRRRSLLYSLGLHLAALAPLCFVTLPAIQQPLDFWLSADAQQEETADLAEVSLDGAEQLDLQADEPSAELLDPGAASLGELSASEALGEIAGEAGPAAGDWADVGTLFGDQGRGLTQFGAGLGGAPLAKFFGASIEGRRIVFVIDNSGSMQDGRLETVIEELTRCVDALNKDQEFYVLFYSDSVYPLFYPEPIDQYASPTPQTKAALERWLKTVELALGDAVVEAISTAAMLEPDTVFLLSDGRIGSQKKMGFLLAGEERNFVIHTVAVGLGAAPAGRRNLAAIAEANHGDFKEAAVPKAMRDLAHTHPRAYHRDQPGDVWGRQVRAGGWGAQR
jgi:hypothetical protein